VVSAWEVVCFNLWHLEPTSQVEFAKRHYFEMILSSCIDLVGVNQVRCTSEVRRTSKTNTVSFQKFSL